MADESGFDLARELDVPPYAISIVDVGAAFYGERALYRPLMTAKLATGGRSPTRPRPGRISL